MGDLVFLDTVQRNRDDRVQALWDAYKAAREKSDATLQIEDGIAAGKAWANWLAAFTGRAS